jgi:hypothetical protein
MQTVSKSDRAIPGLFALNLAGKEILRFSFDSIICICDWILFEFWELEG